jgi:superfamily II DNA or RNA helicase
MTFDNSNKHLTTGGCDPFLPNLLDAINNAIKIDITVAFIRNTGLNLIYSALEDAITRNPPAIIRILTGDYLCVTEPKALRRLLLLEELGAENDVANSVEVKVYETTPNKSFHMKAYVFVQQKIDDVEVGCAYIGSSNLSKMALMNGLEWNLRVDSTENQTRFTEIRNKFETLYQDEQAKHLNHLWIDQYHLRYLQNQQKNKFESEVEIDDSTEIPPDPNPIQIEALEALSDTRALGFKRGLVVLATGIGKTWLAAFDAKAMNAKRILFVAHREEILKQAEATFLIFNPDTKIGRYSADHKAIDVDMLFASVQTLGKTKHLDKFDSGYFDYVVVDEFHHAAARTYTKLLAHFQPRFLLGLTATPERTDQADILQLCDDNLVYRCDLFGGINLKLLCYFHYYGIADEEVDYQEVPWRNGKFDPEALVNQLATKARARHAYKKWFELKQTRTLAFCVSRRHADFMSEYFNQQGVNSVSVHSESTVRRTQALDDLKNNKIDVIFSVDLFNEGVDIPPVDTVLMLRPTESKILFLQQLGRGLRLSPETNKSHLVILDFIGNHVSFFKKPEALFPIEPNNSARRDFINDAETGNLLLPDSCFVNYDLKAIEFMRELTKTLIDSQLDIYRCLKESLDRRPTLTEFYMGGGTVTTVRNEYGQWLKLVQSEDDLNELEINVVTAHEHFFHELESTQMTKSFKMILLEAFIELDGFINPVKLKKLADKSFEVLHRKRQLQHDLPEQFKNLDKLDQVMLNRWVTYWKGNPVSAWVGNNRTNGQSFFKLNDDVFEFNEAVEKDDNDTFTVLSQELINYKLSSYESRSTLDKASVLSYKPKLDNVVNIPFFSDLKIACGYFATSSHDSGNIEYYSLPLNYGHLDPTKHFIAVAKGNSMYGGKNPIKDGDYLLLELITSNNAGSISNQTIAIENQDASGDDQYLLRYIQKRTDGGYDLIAKNSDYPIFQANDSMRTFARLKDIVLPLDMALHQDFMREDIPPLFGHEFNPGAWQSGHVSIKGSDDQYLFVTLNKQGKAQEHQYHDYFVDEQNFNWQSQNSASPKIGKGKRIIEHERNGSNVYLFVRKNKLENKKAAPFFYCGKLLYKKHSSEKPMNVEWGLEIQLPKEIFDYFKV